MLDIIFCWGGVLTFKVTPVQQESIFKFCDIINISFSIDGSLKEQFFIIGAAIRLKFI